MAANTGWKRLEQPEIRVCEVCDAAYTATRTTERTCRMKCEQRRQQLKNKYGLTQKAYLAMLDAQGNVCALCGGDFPIMAGERRTAIDHDHETGRVRGILCYNCNTGLGKLGDQPAALERTHAYFLSTRDILGELLASDDQTELLAA